MTLATASRIFGMSLTRLHELESGKNGNVSRETLARIEGATDGAVTILDHWAAWRNNHISTFTEQRAAGRSAMALHRKTAKTRKK